MKIDIILGAWLSRYLLDPSDTITPKNRTISTTMEVEIGTTVNQVMILCRIPKEEVGLITFNKVKVTDDSILTEDGILNFFPVLIGG